QHGGDRERHARVHMDRRQRIFGLRTGHHYGRMTPARALPRVTSPRLLGTDLRIMESRRGHDVAAANVRAAAFPPPLRGRDREGGSYKHRICWYPPPHPSPARAGESHLDLRCLLHWFGKRILKATPESRRELDAPLQEGFSILAGPAGRERETRSFGSSAYCAGGFGVRGNVVL